MSGPDAGQPAARGAGPEEGRPARRGAAPDGGVPGRGGAGPDTGLPARRAALAALRAVDEDDAWSNLAVPPAIDHLGAARDRAFAAHLAYDTLRWQGTLDWALGQVLSRPLGDVEPALRRVLRLGALQLLRTDVPDRATVAASVELAREQVPSRRAKGAGGFVNGVLRQLARRRDQLPWPPASDPVAHLALTTGHPAWVVEDLLTRHDPTRTADILHADDRPPGVTLRSAASERDALVAELREAGLDAAPGALPEAVRVPGADPRRLPAVSEGRAVVQDEASMHVVDRTGAGPGDRVLDLCAGPGGKTGHLAARVGATGHVTAVELHPHRAELVRRAVDRQGHGDHVEVHVGDALDPPVPAGTTYDAVLLDAPCTGLGTGRRRPEVRWRRRPEDATELSDLQRRLLRSAAPLVAPGGRLTYAVCTWTAAETDAVADHLDDLAAELGLVAEDRVQLLPDRDDTDGMFVARWRRPAAAGQ